MEFLIFEMPVALVRDGDYAVALAIIVVGAGIAIVVVINIIMTIIVDSYRYF